MHQIIYTSTKRGINSVSDGMQIYSYTEGFKDFDSVGVMSLFSYKPLECECSIQPDSFSLRTFNGKKAICMKTDLGKDYMGEKGRMGNFLSHAIIGEEEEFTFYPFELIYGASLRTKMKQSEVNSDKEVAYLPEPFLQKGNYITRSICSRFILEDDNIDILLNMLFALVDFNQSKKRIVILDEHDKTIKWIASLLYLFPLEVSRKIDFSTYEYNPELSSSFVCGAYRNDSAFDIVADREKYFIFDIENKSYPQFDIPLGLKSYVSKFFGSGLCSFFNFSSNIINFGLNNYLDSFYLFQLIDYKRGDYDENIYSGAIKVWNHCIDNSIKVKLLSSVLFDANTWKNVSDDIFEYFSKFMLHSYGGNLGHLTTTVMSVVPYANNKSKKLEEKLCQAIAVETKKSKREVYSVLHSVGRDDLTFEVFKKVIERSSNISLDFNDYFYGFLMNCKSAGVVFGSRALCFLYEVLISKENIDAKYRLLLAIKSFEPNIILIESLVRQLIEELKYQDFLSQKCYVDEILSLKQSIYNRKVIHFVSLYLLLGVSQPSQYKKSLDDILSIIGDGLDLTSLTQNERSNYIMAIASSVKYCDSLISYKSLLNILSLDDVDKGEFIHECGIVVTNAFLEGHITQNELIAYIKLVLYEASPYQRERATKVLSGLPKKTIKAIDKEFIGDLEINIANRWANMRVLLVKKRFLFI